MSEFPALVSTRILGPLVKHKCLYLSFMAIARDWIFKKAIKGEEMFFNFELFFKSRIKWDIDLKSSFKLR